MTGNIKVLSAKWATICGEIVFTTNFSRRKYALRVWIGEGLSVCDLDTSEPRRWQRVERDDVLAIIRQGDDPMWTWQSFLAMWQGFAAGYDAGRDDARCNCLAPNSQEFTMPEALITYVGQQARVACDGNCSKAWGINSRPRHRFPNGSEGDYIYCADSALGEAPADPGTYEGGHAKPASPAEFPNRWCVRECERCAMSRPGEWQQPLTLPDWEHPKPNIS